MDGKHHPQLVREGHEGLYELGKFVTLVHIGWTVQRDHGVRLAVEAESSARIRAFDLPAEHLERIDHDVADACDLLRCNALCEQVCISVRGRCP